MYHNITTGGRSHGHSQYEQKLGELQPYDFYDYASKQTKNIRSP